MVASLGVPRPNGAGELATCGAAGVCLCPFGSVAARSASVSYEFRPVFLFSIGS